MENNFEGKTTCSLSYSSPRFLCQQVEKKAVGRQRNLGLVLPWSRSKIEKSFSPKLTDYFIQWVRRLFLNQGEKKKIFEMTL